MALAARCPEQSTLNLSPVNDPVSAVVLSAFAGDVDAVFVAGQAVKRDGRLLNVDLDHVRTLAQSSIDYLYRTSGFGKAWESLAK
jgi:5-methylthioadenosine/S-adenosylhomocysteine deaminase